MSQVAVESVLCCVCVCVCVCVYIYAHVVLEWEVMMVAVIDLWVMNL